MSVGYGTDLWCTDQIKTGRLVTGVELVAQALYRRLTTARGTLRDGADGEVYGTDVSDFVGTVGPDNAVDAIPDVIVAEVLQDDRIDSASVQATLMRDAMGLATITVEVNATLQDDGTDFTLTLGISEVSVTLLGVTVAV